MTDTTPARSASIVARLRQGAGHVPEDIIAAETVMAEAADEIERLRSDGSELAAEWTTTNQKLRDEFGRLREEATIEVARLLMENERLRSALQEIEQWSRAYPLTVFPKPDLKRARELLQAGSMTLDAVSADAMRHVVEGVGEIARRALEQKP